jgi:hypothetical protein
MLDLDVVLFEQVLVNLLDNAAKYSPPGSRIAIAAAFHGRQVELTISDEGPGIPAEDLERVFEMFHRVNKGDRQRAGTGLGLSICRGFVEVLGGTIQAANRLDGPGGCSPSRSRSPSSLPCPRRMLPNDPPWQHSPPHCRRRAADQATAPHQPRGPSLLARRPRSCSSIPACRIRTALR